MADRTTIALIPLLALALSLGACVGGRDDRAELVLHDCRVSGLPARCGTLPVYENRATMSGRTIDLFVAVLPAKGSDRSADPIFFLSGGPGGAATEDIGSVREVFRQASRRRDLVLLDQRGTGSSNELLCPPVDEDGAEELRACLAELPGDSRAYTTAWAMDDLDEVRAALGYDTINLYGASYGASAAQVYLQRYPDRVRTAALVAGTPLDIAIFEWYPRSSQQALGRLFSRCAAEPECQEAYPDPQADLDAVAARLDRGPVELSEADSPTGQRMVFTRENMGPTVHNILFGTDTAPTLPRLLRAAREGDWPTVARELPTDPAGSDDVPAMTATILCHEPWARLRRAPTEAASVGSYLTYADVRTLLGRELCAVVPAPEAAALYDPPTPVSVPVLVINGDADPQDPPELMENIDATYPNSRLLTAPGQAHANWNVPASCLGSIIGGFVDTASVAVSAHCLEQVSPPLFSQP